MDNQAHIPNRRAAFVFAVLVLGAASLVFLRWTEMPMGAATDDAYYVEMARSVAEGRGPVLHLNDVAGPWPADLFPPGLPVLLAPLAKIAPGAPGLMKIVPLLAWLALLPLCLAWPTRGSTPGRRMMLAALVLINPWTVAYAARIVSDLPYTALSLGALLAYRAWSTRPGAGRFFLLILLTVVAVTVRSVGWALPVAMVAQLVLTRRWKKALMVAACCGLPLVAIHLGTAPYGAGLFSGGYEAQILDAAGTSRVALVLDNTLGYLKEIPALLLPVFGEPTRTLGQGIGLGAIYNPMLMILGAGILVLVVFGWRRGRTGAGPDLFVIYVALYALALINFSGWPTGVQTRLLIPLLPLLIDGLLGWFEKRTAFLLPVAGLLLITALVHNGYRVARPPLDPTFDPGLGSSWAKQNSEKGETFLVRMPLKQHLHLGRPTVGYGVLTDEALDIRIARFDVQWILLGPEPVTAEGESPTRSETLAALLAARPTAFPLAAEDPEGRFKIFRVAEPTPGRIDP